MEMKFIPIDFDYFDYEGKNYIEIFGRNEDGKKICVIDFFEPYVWAILEDNLKEKKINEILSRINSISLNSKGRETKVEKTQIKEKNFLGKSVKAIKIYATNYKDLPEIAEHLKIEGIEKIRGYDVGITTSYIIEKKIEPMNWYKISGDVLNESDDFGGIDRIIETDFVIKLEKFSSLKEENF